MAQQTAQAEQLMEHMYQQYARSLRLAAAGLLPSSMSPLIHDLVQDVFVTFAEVVLDRGLLCLQDDLSAEELKRACRKYLVTSLENRCRQQARMRRNNGHRQLSEIPAELFASRAQSPEEVCQNHELCRHVQEALDKLSDEQRTVLVLHEILGLSHRDISDSLGISVKASRSRLARGRKQLRRELAPAIGSLVER